MNISVFLLALVMMAPPAQAGSHINGKAYAGQRYDVVRKTLKRNGLTPVRIHHTAEADPYCREDFCEKYPESLSCTGGGVFLCLMVYRGEGGKYKIVLAGGEPYLKVDDIYDAPPEDIEDIRAHNRKR